MNKLFCWFVKLTSYPLAQLVFRTRWHFEDKKRQSHQINGPAIVICNHTSVYDFAILMYAFMSRNLRCEMAEILFERKFLLPHFLRMMGGIFVDRRNHDFGFMQVAAEILNQGGVVCVFPEGRLPQKGESTPLPFSPSAALTALQTGCEVIPVYSDGNYFGKGRNHVMIGTPLRPCTWIRPGESYSDTIRAVSDRLREEVIRLGGMLDETKG